MGTGFIFSWDKKDVAGVIQVTGGPVFVGDAVAFAIDDCNAALQAKLRQRSIPPDAAINVRFEFMLFQGHVLATKVSEM